MSLITKKISELTSISSPSSASLLLVQDGDTTYNFGLNNVVLSKNDANAFVGNDGPAGNVFYLQRLLQLVLEEFLINKKEVKIWRIK